MTTEEILARGDVFNQTAGLDTSTTTNKLDLLQTRRQEKLQKLSNTTQVNILGMQDADTFRLEGYNKDIRESDPYTRYDATELPHGEPSMWDKFKQTLGISTQLDNKSDYAADKQREHAAKVLGYGSIDQVTDQDLTDIANMQQIQKLADLARSPGEERWVAPLIRGSEPVNLTGRYVNAEGKEEYIPLNVKAGIKEHGTDTYGRTLASMYNQETGEDVTKKHANDYIMNAFAERSGVKVDDKGYLVGDTPSAKEDESNLIDQAQSQALSLYADLSNALRKTSRSVADKLGVSQENIDKYLPMNEKLIGFDAKLQDIRENQDLRDSLVGYSKADREAWSSAQQEVLEAAENKNYGKLAWKIVTHLPEYLADSAPEMAALMVPGAGLPAVVGTRLSNQMEEFKKNNGRDMTAGEAIETGLAITATLAYEKALIKTGIAGALEKGTSKLGRVGGVAGTALGEAGQEVAEKVQEDIYTGNVEDRRDLDKIIESATDAEALVSAAAGGIMGGALRGAGETAGAIKDKLVDASSDLTSKVTEKAKEFTETQENKRTKAQEKSIFERDYDDLRQEMVQRVAAMDERAARGEATSEQEYTEMKRIHQELKRRDAAKEIEKLAKAGTLGSISDVEKGLRESGLMTDESKLEDDIETILDTYVSSEALADIHVALKNAVPEGVDKEAWNTRIDNAVEARIALDNLTEGAKAARSGVVVEGLTPAEDKRGYAEYARLALNGDLDAYDNFERFTKSQINKREKLVELEKDVTDTIYERIDEIQKELGNSVTREDIVRAMVYLTRGDDSNIPTADENNIRVLKPVYDRVSSALKKVGGKNNWKKLEWNGEKIADYSEEYYSLSDNPGKFRQKYHLMLPNIARDLGITDIKWNEGRDQAPVSKVIGYISDEIKDMERLYEYVGKTRFPSDTKVEETKAEEVKVEEPKIEKPKIEKPKVEEAKVEEQATEEVKPTDEKVKETVQKEEPTKTKTTKKASTLDTHSKLYANEKYSNYMKKIEDSDADLYKIAVKVQDKSIVDGKEPIDVAKDVRDAVKAELDKRKAEKSKEEKAVSTEVKQEKPKTKRTLAEKLDDVEGYIKDVQETLESLNKEKVAVRARLNKVNKNLASLATMYKKLRAEEVNVSDVGKKGLLNKVVQVLNRIASEISTILKVQARYKIERQDLKDKLNRIKAEIESTKQDLSRFLEARKEIKTEIVERTANSVLDLGVNTASKIKASDILEIRKEGGMPLDLVNEPLRSKLKEHSDRVAKVLKNVVVGNKKHPGVVNDVSRVLMVKPGEFHPAVVDAISNGIIQYTTRLYELTYNDDVQIAKMLGMSTESQIPADVRNEMKNVGRYHGLEAAALGKDILRQVGLQQKEDVEYTTQEQIEVLLGSVAIAAAENMNMLKYSNDTLNTAKYIELKQKVKEYNSGNVKAIDEGDEIAVSKNKNLGVPVIKAGKMTANKVAEEYKELAQELEGILPEWGKKGPVSRPLGKREHKVRGMENEIDIPKPQQDTLNKMENLPWELDLDSINWLKAVWKNNEQDVREMLGWVDPASVHIDLRDGVEGKNRSIEKSIVDLLKFAEKQSSKPFYFKWFFSKSGRFFMDSNTVNPQTNKLHRFVMGYKGAESIVDTEEQRNEFKLAVVQAFDGKEFEKEMEVNGELVRDLGAIDKQSLAKSLQDFENIKARLKDLKESDVLDMIKGTDHPMHALMAINEMRKYDENKPFKTKMTIETDAITSGFILGLLTHPVMPLDKLKTWLAKGGVWLGGTEYTSFGEYKEKSGDLDSYETGAREVKALLDARVNGDKKLQALDKIVGGINRKFMKAPLMTFIYGSSGESIKKSIGRHYADEVLNRLSNEKTIEETAKLLDEAGIVKLPVTKENAKRLAAQIREASVANRGIVNQIHKAVASKVSNLHGQAVADFLSTEFEDIVGKNKLKSTLNKAFVELYKTFKAEYDARIKDVKSKAERDAVLDAMMKEGKIPGVFTVNSDQTNGKEKTPIVKKQKVSSVKSVQAQLVPKQRTVHPLIREMVAAPASGAVLNIHWLDGSIINEILGDKVLGIHDAKLGVVGTAAKDAQEYSKAVWDMTQKYSVVEQLVKENDKIQNEEVVANLKALDKIIKANKAEFAKLGAKVEHMSIPGGMVEVKGETKPKPTKPKKKAKTTPKDGIEESDTIDIYVAEVEIKQEPVYIKEVDNISDATKKLKDFKYLQDFEWLFVKDGNMWELVEKSTGWPIGAPRAHTQKSIMEWLADADLEKFKSLPEKVEKILGGPKQYLKQFILKTDNIDAYVAEVESKLNNGTISQGNEMAYVPNKKVEINGKYYEMMKDVVDEVVGPEVSTSKRIAFSKASFENLNIVAGKYANNKITIAAMDKADVEAEAERILRDYYGDQDTRYAELDAEEFGKAVANDPEIKKLVDSNKLKLVEEMTTMYAKAKSSHVLAHEYIHAGASEYMKANPKAEATVKIQKLYEEALENEEKIVKDMLATGASMQEATYWMRNVDEFLAEALTNPKLMAPLSQIKSRYGKNRLANILKELVNTALDMLGIKKEGSIYANTLDGYMTIVEAQRRKDLQASNLQEVAQSILKQAELEAAEAMNKCKE